MMFKKMLRATRPSKPRCLGRSRLLYALCLLFFLLGCQAASLTGLRPPLEEEGEVYLYIQPFPQEAERLRFTLEEVCAVSGDGREIPFTLSLAELKAPDLRRQRLLAHGRLPPGPYVGLSFKVKKAILKVEEGEASLLLPERPVRIDFPFTVNRKRAQVISLIFRYEGSIIGGVSFSPSFSVVTPAKPISSVVGYVTNKASHNITVFDKKLRQVVGVIAAGAGPAGMAGVFGANRLLTEADRTALSLLASTSAQREENEEKLRKTGTLYNVPGGAVRISPLMKIGVILFDREWKLLREFGGSPSSRTRVQTVDPEGDMCALERAMAKPSKSESECDSIQ